VVRGQKGEYRDLFEDMIRQGYARARVNGQVVSLNDPPALSRQMRHNIEIVVDRLTISPAVRARLAEAVENALRLGTGTVIVARSHEATEPRSHEGETSDLLLSSHYACPECDVSFEEPSPQLFSFNAPAGMCPTCDGMGTIFDFDPDLLVSDPSKSFVQHCVEPMRIHMRMGRWRKHIYQGVADHVGFDLKTPWKKLPDKAKRALLYGLGETHVTYNWRGWGGGRWRHGGTFAGVIAELRERYGKSQSSFMREYYEKFMRKRVCETCRGARLNGQALAVRIAGVNIHDVCAKSIDDAYTFFEGLTLPPMEQRIARDVLKEIRGRLQFLRDVGLEYLSLERTAPTLSGGESQRIRLASQIGAGLVGVLYILDEPSIGLHARDQERLLDSLRHLRDLGNTVIVVEHDEQTMRAADEIVDFGPGPGVRGGEVVARGSIGSVCGEGRSLTGRYLRGELTIPVPTERRPVKRDRRENGLQRNRADAPPTTLPGQAEAARKNGRGAKTVQRRKRK